MGLPSHGSTFQTEHHCVVNGRSLPQPPFDIPSLGLRGHPIGATGHPTTETPPEDSDYGEPADPDELQLQAQAERFLEAAEKQRKRLREETENAAPGVHTIDGVPSYEVQRADSGQLRVYRFEHQRLGFPYNNAHLEGAETQHHMYVKAAVRRTK